jgi:hypothetical protein
MNFIGYILPPPAATAVIATRTTVLTPTAASDAVSLAAKTTWLRAPTLLNDSA